jgi:hypothetical protein
MAWLSLVVALVLLVPSPALAQSSKGGLGGVLDILTGVLGGGRLTGHVVLVRDNHVVLRTADARTVRVDAAAVDARIRDNLKPGEPITVVPQSPPAEGGVVRAAEIQLGAPAGQSPGQKTFRQVEGTIAEADGSQVVFRTREGLTLPLDVSRVTGLPTLKPQEPATLVYEQGPRHEIVAVWVEPGSLGAAAAAPPVATSTPGTSDPSASVPGAGPDRVFGVVQRLSGSTLTLRTSEGRTVSVDTSRVDPQARARLREGDLVVASGRATGPDRLEAERVEVPAPAGQPRP